MPKHAFTDHTGSRISLELPDNWVSSPDPRTSVTMKDNRDGALLQITLHPRLLAENLRQKLHEIVDLHVAKALETSVEKSIRVRDFRGSAGAGYYFSSQDRELKPGGWAFATCGLAADEEHVFHFTI